MLPVKSSGRKSIINNQAALTRNFIFPDSGFPVIFRGKDELKPAIPESDSLPKPAFKIIPAVKFRRMMGHYQYSHAAQARGNNPIKTGVVKMDDIRPHLAEKGIKAPNP